MNDYIDEIHQVSVVIIIELVVHRMVHIPIEVVRYQVVVKLVLNQNIIVVEVMYEQQVVVQELVVFLMHDKFVELMFELGELIVLIEVVHGGVLELNLVV